MKLYSLPLFTVALVISTIGTLAYVVLINLRRIGDWWNELDAKEWM